MNLALEINCDLGEYHPETGFNNDESIIPLVDMANICCGFHSGSPQLIKKTIQLCLDHGVKIGAHPSYNDRASFGRKPLKEDPDKTMADLIYQVSALKSMVEFYGGQLHHVKAHGALYHKISHDPDYARMFAATVKKMDRDIKIIGMPFTQLETACNNLKLKFIRECFADRKYISNKQLMPRSEITSVISNNKELEKHIKGIVNCTLTDVYNNKYKIKTDTICVHSDTPESAEKIKIIRKLITTKIN